MMIRIGPRWRPGIVVIAVAVACLIAAPLALGQGAARQANLLEEARTRYLEGDAPMTLDLLALMEVDSPALRADAMILEAYALYSLGRPAAALAALERIERNSLTSLQKVDHGELLALLFRRAERHKRPDHAAPLRSGSIVIDGDLADWSGMPVLPEIHAWRGRALMRDDSRLREYGWSGRTELEDGSGAVLRHAEPFTRVFLAWDTAAITLAFSIDDTTVVIGDSTTGILEDHVQFFIDAADQKTVYYKRGIYNFWVEPRTGGRLGMRNRAAGVPPVVSVLSVHGAAVAVKRHAAGYDLEIMIPRSAMPEFRPEENPWIGFDFLVVDHDKPGRLARRAAWRGVPGTPTGVVQEIEKWGTISLVGAVAAPDTTIEAPR